VVQACRADSNWQLPSFTCAEGGRARTRTRTAPAGGRRQEAAGVRRAEPGHAATYLPQVMTRCLMAVRWPMYMSPPPPMWLQGPAALWLPKGSGNVRRGGRTASGAPRTADFGGWMDPCPCLSTSVHDYRASRFQLSSGGAFPGIDYFAVSRAGDPRRFRTGFFLLTKC
jgi:hypothetical protein